MAQNEFHLFSSEDPTRSSNLCARCGETAQIHLTLLGETPARAGSFCFSCGEALMHALQQTQEAHAYADAEVVYPSFLYSPAHHEDVEGGIVFWEGHGWSSDGPFAGA